MLKALDIISVKDRVQLKSPNFDGLLGLDAELIQYCKEENCYDSY